MSQILAIAIAMVWGGHPLLASYNMTHPQKDFANQEVVTQTTKSAASMRSLSPVHGEEAERPDQPSFLNMESSILNGSHKTLL